MQNLYSSCNPDWDLWERLAKEERPILLYGTGNGADKILDQCLARGIQISGVFASDGFVRSRTFRSFPVTSYADAKKRFGNMVVLLSFATSLPEVMAGIDRIASEQVLLVPDVPVCGEQIFDAAFVTAHATELAKVRGILADEQSRQLFDDMVACKRNGDYYRLRKAYSNDPDGLSSLLHPNSYRVAADLGAYIGDTALRLAEKAPNLEALYCLEPDPKTFARMQRSIGNNPWARLFPMAAWDREETLSFRIGGSRSSGIGQNGKTASVQATSLDVLLCGKRCDYIKFDVEGADLPALRGCEKTIRAHHPELLLSLYHRSEDLFRLPLALLDIRSDYDLYLRRADSLPAWDLNLIAIPKKE